MVRNDHKDRDLGTFESLQWELYRAVKIAGGHPCHSSLRLGNANYTELKCFTAKGTSQVDLQISQTENYKLPERWVTNREAITLCI